MSTLADLGYDLTECLEKYMNWLGLQNEYNVNVLRVFYVSLTATVKVRDITQRKSEIARVDFRTTVRGRKIKFNWRHINHFLGLTDPELNKWSYPERLDQANLELAYGTSGKRVSGMAHTKRVLQYIYSRIMTHKGGNFSEFTQLDNPWLARFLNMEPINPGQLISL